MSLYDVITSHKALPALLGLVGAAIAMTYSPSPPGRRQWFAAVLSGGAFAWVGTSVAVAAIRHFTQWEWLPTDGSVEGLVGLLLGIAGMRLVSGIISLTTAFSNDPVGFFASAWSKLRGKGPIA